MSDIDLSTGDSIEKATNPKKGKMPIKDQDWFDIFKAIVPILASAILSITVALSLFTINNQNKAQEKKIAEDQAKASLKISANREISNLISQLTSTDKNVRKYAAMGLSLYGEEVLPVLIFAAGDYDYDFRVEVVRALEATGKNMNGDVFISTLENTWNNTNEEWNRRKTCLEALAKIGDWNVYDFSVKEYESTHDISRIKDLSYIIRLTKDNRAGQFFSNQINKYKYQDYDLTYHLLDDYYYYNQSTCNTDPELTDLYLNLFNHPDTNVGQAALNLFWYTNNTTVMGNIYSLSQHSKDQGIKQKAQHLVNYYTRRGYTFVERS